jgi:hypothetical protein
MSCNAGYAPSDMEDAAGSGVPAIGSPMATRPATRTLVIFDGA